MMTILAGKYPTNIAPDHWLSGLMGKDVFRITLDPQFVSYPGIMNAHKLHEGVFLYSKVAVHDSDGIRFLEEQGFYLTDTNVTFEKPVEQKAVAVNGVTFRLAKPDDQEKVKALAGSCFRYSRFHLDPSIAPELANTIKAQWAGNFFNDKRGQAMIVAQKGNAVVGFLQLLNDNKGTITIDLVGVDENNRQQGIAEAMINFAQTQFSQATKIVVGTQIVNVSSIRCYEKLGFRFVNASYVFHYHG